MRYFYTFSKRADTAFYDKIKSDITELYPAYSPGREVKEPDESRRISFSDSIGHEIIVELDYENHLITVTSDTELFSFAQKYKSEISGKELHSKNAGTFFRYPDPGGTAKKIKMIFLFVIMPIISILAIVIDEWALILPFAFWILMAIPALIFIPAALISAAKARSCAAYKLPLVLFLTASIIIKELHLLIVDIAGDIFNGFEDFIKSAGVLYMIFLPLTITDGICGKIRDNKFGDRLTDSESLMIDLAVAVLLLFIGLIRYYFF